MSRRNAMNARASRERQRALETQRRIDLDNERHRRAREGETAAER